MLGNVEQHAAPTITLAIGGVRVQFASADPNLVMRVTFPRTRFVDRSSISPDSTIRVQYGDPNPSSKPWFVSGGTWEIHEGKLGGDRVVFYTALANGGRAPLSCLDLTPDLGHGELVVDRTYVRDDQLEVGFPLDEYLLARLLARRSATILHASCVAENGGAFVFTGQSGAGKSTISTIAQQAGWRVLSDDRTILSLRDGVVHAEGTPFHGSHKSGMADSVPVHGIFLLEQADEDRADRMGASRAFAEVLVRTVRPLVDIGEQSSIVETVERVMKLVPAAVLRFRPTRAALATARAFVSK